jgi:hypothetical protein
VFQLLEGIHRVRVSVQGQMHDLIEGLNEVQIKILRLFGQERTSDTVLSFCVEPIDFIKDKNGPCPIRANVQTASLHVFSGG